MKNRVFFKPGTYSSARAAGFSARMVHEWWGRFWQSVHKCNIQDLWENRLQKYLGGDK